jgi:hypothetical protein
MEDLEHAAIFALLHPGVTVKTVMGIPASQIRTPPPLQKRNPAEAGSLVAME